MRRLGTSAHAAGQGMKTPEQRQYQRCAAPVRSVRLPYTE